MGGMVVGMLADCIVLGAFSLIQPGYAECALLSIRPACKILKLAAVLDVMAFVTIRRLLQIGSIEMSPMYSSAILLSSACMGAVRRRHLRTLF